MAREQKVLLYGSSLFIAGLQTSLEAEGGLEVERISAQPDLLRKCLSENTPDVLILESGASAGEMVFTILNEFPHLALIGLDPESGRLLALSIEEGAPMAAGDLVRLIRQRARSQEGGS